MSLTPSENLVVNRLKRMGGEMEGWLQNFVSIDSHTDCHEGVNKLGWEVERELLQSGLRTSSFVTGVSGQYLIGRSRAEDSHHLMLLGHLDTVFPSGSVDLKVETDPEDPRKLLGPGACDMKGGLVVMLAAIRALHLEGLLADKSLTVLFSADEETGSPAGRDMIAKEVEEQHLCLVFEAGTPGEGDRTKFVTSRKGMARYQLKIQGVAAHSGIAKELGVSAALEAAHKIIALEALNDSEIGNTVTVGLVTSGSSVNTVPEFATLEIDCRFTDPQHGEALRARILEIGSIAATKQGASSQAPTLELKELCGHEPFVRTDAVERMANRIIAWGQDLGLDLEEESRGGASDGNIAAAVGIPTVDGLGVVGGKIHSHQEWLYKESLVERSCLLALTMMRFYEL